MKERRTPSLSPALSPLHQRILYLTVALLWVSGALWMYWQFFGSHGNAAVSPSQVLALRVHGALAMVFLVVLGSLFPVHLYVGWGQRKNRPSGAFVIATCLILILTGWGLYYSGNDSIRGFLSPAHAYLGLALPLIIYLHV